ncbi:50S ribosomal protein L32 [Patescibacteria group bacterium]|nr:50S ribosomal protein L32 [Patescibacteria group bacterium]
MAVPKQHRSKSRQGQRRMHIYLKGTSTAICPKCSKAVLPHTVCANCGFYRGKEMIDVLTKLTKRERKAKEKEMASQKEQVKSQGELSPEGLSRSSS